jgi:myo-inositol-1(or 4)-monophosphatase
MVAVTSNDLDLQHARSVAVSIAAEAGAVLRAGFHGPFDVHAKGSSGDVVTSLDLAAEGHIVSRLRAEFPDHRIVAEESGVHGGDTGRTWMVDPLDGTNNVAIGLPAYVVGMALCVDRRPAVGVVHDVNTNQTWSAIRGGGALGPYGRISPGASPPRRSSRRTNCAPVLGWTQGHAVSRSDATACALKLTLDQHAQRLLQLWAPLLCWVMLARGDIDGFVGYQPGAIDLVAGTLLATEAGLTVVTLTGDPFDESVSDAAERSFVAGHPDRIPELLDLVRAAEATRPDLLPLLAKQPATVV